MAYLLISDRFWQAPEVVKVGTRAIGLWVKIACYHASWQDYDVPKTVLRMCKAEKTDIAKLLAVGWLIESEDGWRLGLEDAGLWKIGNAVDGRPSRPQIPPAVRSAVFERDEHACLKCGRTDDLTLDHILPWSHGGPDTVENLRVLCRPCNSSRGNRVERETVGG